MGANMRTTIFILFSLVLSVSVASATESMEMDQEQVLLMEDRSEATPQQMAGIWHSLKAVRTEAERVSVLMYVSRHYWLRTVQVEALVEMISSEEARAELLVALYPRLTNPERFEKLMRLLPDASLRQSTLSRVGVEVTAAL